MSIQEGVANNNNSNVSCDTQDMLDNKIDKLISMMSKLPTESSNQNRLLKPKILRGRGEDKVEIIIMIEIGNEKGLDWAVRIDIEDQIIDIDLNMDKIIEKCLNMIRIIKEEILGEETI